MKERLVPGLPSIEEFYAVDPRRKSSHEQIFGTWQDQADPDHLYDLSRVQETGELYAMRKPRPDKWLPLVPRDSVINLREEIRDVLQDIGDAEHGIFDCLHPRHVRAKTDVHLHHHADAYDEELQVGYWLTWKRRLSSRRSWQVGRIMWMTPTD